MVNFNNIPTTLRVPFTYVEFDASKAQQGPSVQPFVTLLMGQKLAAGSQDELVEVIVTSEAQAITLFGQGSMLHHMVKAYLANDQVTELRVIAIDDAAAGVQATGKITVATGTATEDGTFYVYIGGVRIPVSVSSGDDQDDVTDAIVAAITAYADSPVSAVENGVNPNETDLTAKHKGEDAGLIDVRFNYNDGEEFPAGISASITDMSGGTTNPDVSEIIAVMTEQQYNVIVNPWLDAANLGLLETELLSRWEPTRQNDGLAFGCRFDTLSNLSTLGNSRNSKHSAIFGPAKSAPVLPYAWAAGACGQIAKSAQADPARPFQTLQVLGVLAPKESEQFLLSERNILLTDGIATAKFDAGGASRIERAITTYQTNAASAPDTTFLDSNTLFTLSFLRYDFRTQMLVRYPRHKLADDGVRVPPGAPIMTPKIGKAEAVRIFSAWQNDLGLVEGLDQFKRDLVVERSSQDPNRLDFLLPPDLMNQLRIIGAQIQFLL